MVGENLAVATGWGTFAAGLQPAIFVKTTDGGKNWAYMDQTDANKFYYYFKGIYMKDATNGVAFGGSAAYFGGKIYKTTDGGTNWFQTLTNVPFEIQRIAVFPNKVYYLTNYSEVYSASDIFGTNLTPVIMPGIALSSICFPSANVGYASSTSAPAYIKTTDGGKTWLTKSILFPLTVPSLTKNRTINQLQFLNENVGFATCTGRNLHKTTNGGETWMPIIADTSVLSNFNCNASYFVNENLGWAVARYAGTSPNYNYAIYKTSDGGASWSQTTGAKELNAIHFTNTTTGVAVGKAGNIMYTTDAGNTWTAAICPTTSQFSGVKFITPTNVIAISDSGRIISSADAGKTWTLNTAAQTAYNAYNFNSIFVKDNQNIYICGYRSKPALRGTLIYSNDGGTTFSDLSDTATFQNNVVDFTIDPSGAWWAITPSSTIYSTKNLTGVEAISNVIPVNYELSQNYPNPFNPTTMISWKMMNRGKVELRIFDVLGKEVKSLVNETKDAGTYKVNWDGKNNNGKAVSTGIYYYMLKANNFVDVKKMMMLK
jgi:photosystem II stability/assembly factor-like uncharacterized protein